MPTERTLAIFKPDVLEKGVVGKIVSRIESAGLKPVGMRLTRLTQEQAEAFYAVHRERPFYPSLVKFMTSGPVVVVALEGPDAVAKWREVMGATDPAKAAQGTIRKDFATNVEQNSVHGSDSLDNAREELAFFFSYLDICAYEWKRRS